MPHDVRNGWPHALAVLAAGLAMTLTPPRAQAASFELIYAGSFNNQDALNLATQTTPTYFSGETPFTINAWFDTSSPNLAPPSPPAPPPFAGFRAYSPYLATLSVGGQTYTIEPYTTNPTAGVTVAIFDRNSFTPDRYAIGILQQPPQDGAGIIGDFSGATPDFTAGALTATTLTGFNGVGHGSGVCIQGTGADCQLNAITPFVLHSDNQTFDLTLGNYDAVYSEGADADPTAVQSSLNTAELVATPEPGTLAAVGAALAGLFGLARRRRTY